MNNTIGSDANANEKDQPDFLGLLMLDTNFPRYPGDIGNPESFSFPVKQKTVENASPSAIIRADPQSFLKPFVDAAIELEQNGAKLISTSCGFLTLFQQELQQAVPVPVLTSSLFLHKTLSRRYSEKGSVGILTIAASSLSERHLAAADIQLDTPIGTTEGGRVFTSAILENRDELDFQAAKQDNVEAALRLRESHPDMAAILLECTNMPPYTDAIRVATGLDVFSILDGLNAMWNGRLEDITLQMDAESDFQNGA